MLYKTTSVERVIAKVMTDLDLKEGDHRISDQIEWASEALEKIGAFPSFVNKVTGKDDIPLLTVLNYQVKLPCDFYNLIQCSFSTNQQGPYYPMRYGTGNFDSGNPEIITDDSNANIVSDVASTSDLVTLAMLLYADEVGWPADSPIPPGHTAYQHALARINADPALRSKLTSILNIKTPTLPGVNNPMATTRDITYVVTEGYIKMNVEAGYIMMAYQAIPTDNKGYPMIPDDASFIEAIYWYIVMKLYYPQWVAGQIRDAVYYDARRSWNYYCKQAYGQGLMPNTDQLESIKNSWVRLIPEINEHMSGFSALGQSQRAYVHN
jgi:hypothetical protein